MHRQPKFKKMLATLATWQLLMISMSYPLPGVASRLQNSGNWQHIDIKGF
jgi:hypothetical protein